MSTQTSFEVEGALQLSARILEELFDRRATGRVGVRLWDGTPWPDAAPRPATLVLHHPGALRAMFLPGTEVGLGEAYIYDDFDVEGDLEQVFSIADGLTRSAEGLRSKFRLGGALLRLPSGDGGPRAGVRRGPARLSGKPHSPGRDRQAVAYHYNVSNDFYALWLDQRMVYSCAYFHTPTDSLDAAQEQKLEHICRKLRLRPGQRLLDIGCGWGGLGIYAAQRYGVDVTGITLSQPQADLANLKIRAAGLTERARVQVCDYRELDDSRGFDVLVSVGMFEHVGAALLPAYFEQAYRLLRPGGVFLNHGIACRVGEDGPLPASSFSQAYVFPDGELEPINVPLRAAETAGFEVRDVESLREHYTLTLRHWVRRLETNHALALACVDEPTYRTWRLYMSASAQGFASGRLNVYQSLLAKPGADGQSGLPLTRQDWYRPG